MKKENHSTWSRLDQTALDIEFLLISIIQGVALTTLAGAAMRPIEMLEWQSFPYIATGFLLILIFWSGAIIHALSFIDWPLDLNHTFLYFLASFFEVIAFSQVTHPLYWFIFILLFQIVAGVLYIYDLSLIKKHKTRFSGSSAMKKLFFHIFFQQEKELKIFVPFSILYSIVAITSVLIFSNLFIEKHYHLFFILGQFVLCLAVLKNAILSFKGRSLLLSNAEKSKYNINREE